jgi:hypothetical protein
MEDHPMYLGLIQIVNADLEHRYPTEHAYGESQTGSAPPQLVKWLRRIFRGGSVPADIEKRPAERN